MTDTTPVRTAVAAFARPADTTQYALGDLVADSATAGEVTPLAFAGGPALVRRAMLTKDDDDTTSASFRLHLFATDPVATAPEGGDNGALSLNTAVAGYLGALDVAFASAPDIYNTAGNVAVGVPLQGSEIFVPADVGTLYGLIEARGTYTPAGGETFSATLDLLRF